MDLPSNRMSKPGRKAEGSFDTSPAPPIALPRRVLPFICPKCGRAQSSTVVKTYPEKNHADVKCGACASNLTYTYATESSPPLVRFWKP